GGGGLSPVYFSRARVSSCLGYLQGGPELLMGAAEAAFSNPDAIPSHAGGPVDRRSRSSVNGMLPPFDPVVAAAGPAAATAAGGLPYSPRHSSILLNMAAGGGGGGAGGGALGSPREAAAAAAASGQVANEAPNHQGVRHYLSQPMAVSELPAVEPTGSGGCGNGNGRRSSVTGSSVHGGCI
ncbi:hypothetical protein Agub_g10929, partial [Astrephomene gubernaculifera]